MSSPEVTLMFRTNSSSSGKQLEERDWSLPTVSTLEPNSDPPRRRTRRCAELGQNGETVGIHTSKTR